MRPELSDNSRSTSTTPRFGRLPFTGDLGYEIWCTPDFQLALYDDLRAAGEDLGLRHFGARALQALRLEKSFGSFTREYTSDYSPVEAGLGAFLDLRKNSFIGRDAVLAERDTGPERERITLVVDVEDADAFGNEPIYHDGKVVGWVTSGGYSHHTRLQHRSRLRARRAGKRGRVPG